MNESAVEPVYLRPAEACALLRCGRSYLRTLARSGKLTPRQLSKRLTLYSRAELRALIENAACKESDA